MKWLLLILGLVIGVGLGLYLRAHRVIEYPNMQPQAHKKLGDGDPPVTVSDGSFYATSLNDWLSTGDTVLVPNGNTGPGKLGFCSNMPSPGMVGFYDDPNPPVDISPGNNPLVMTITHGSRSVIAVTNSDHTNLILIDLNHGWQPQTGNSNQWNNSDADDIKEVQYVDVNGNTVKVTAKGKQASVKFCYE